MDAALGWIGDLVRYLAQLFPRLQLVRATDRCVKFTGSRTREVGPGLHVWWPLVTEMEIHPVVRQVKSLPEQKLQTSDGTTVVVDAVLIFDIQDLHTFIVENWEADDSLEEVAQEAVLTVVMEMSIDQLRDPVHRKRVNQRLTSEAKKALRGFGVNTEKLRLQSLAPGTVLIHAGDNLAEFSVGIAE